MKRKYLSLFNAILSIAVGLTFLLFAIVLLVRAINAKEYIPTADANLWIIRVLQRLKAAGFNIFFSIAGIILTLMLAMYRFTLSYFYFKVSKTDGALYRARLGDIIFYSVLAGFVIGVTAWLSFGGKGILPAEVQPFTLILFIAYILLCALPLVEIILVYLIKVLTIKKKQTVPTRENIIQELDDLADKTAMDIANQQVEKESEEKPIESKTSLHEQENVEVEQAKQQETTQDSVKIKETVDNNQPTEQKEELENKDESIPPPATEQIVINEDKTENNEQTTAQVEDNPPDNDKNKE